MLKILNENLSDSIKNNLINPYYLFESMEYTIAAYKFKQGALLQFKYAGKVELLQCTKGESFFCSNNEDYETLFQHQVNRFFDFIFNTFLMYVNDSELKKFFFTEEEYLSNKSIDDYCVLFFTERGFDFDINTAISAAYPGFYFYHNPSTGMFIIHYDNVYLMTKNQKTFETQIERMRISAQKKLS